jgi:DNA repair protein RadC
VSLKLVRESSVLYRERQIKSPEDAYKLLKPFLVEADREKFVVVCLDTKNQPTAINVCHVGSLNSSIVHPREVMKIAHSVKATGPVSGLRTERTIKEGI